MPGWSSKGSCLFPINFDLNKLTVLMLLQGIVDQFKGGNVQYFYIQYMLGGIDNNFMQMIYQIVTGVPLGIGAFLIYPIAKKVGIRNLTIGGYSLVLIGSIIGWIFPDQMVPALIGGFLRNIGWMPNSYIFITLLYFAFDSIEYKSHVRLEGLMGTGIVTAVMTLIYAPFAGGYESAILRLGFVDVAGVVPSDEVKAFMTLSFYLFDIILAAAFIILLPFVDVEKKMPEITAELLRRKKEAVLAKGEEWIEPEEQDRLEKEQEEREFEENRIKDLKERCAKKGLDFETENQKYLVKKAEKEQKKQGDNLMRKGFPDDFLWGASTAAPQIEGGYNCDGRTPSIWDVAPKEKIKNGEDCRTACDHFHKYKEDIAIMKELGLKSYRFSISWSRVISKDGVVNPKGLEFYSNLVDELIKNNIEPLVTLYHWDLPLWQYNKGGWLKEDIINDFQFYARTVVEALSDRVKYWITFNEPSCFLMNGYMQGVHAPFKRRY